MTNRQIRMAAGLYAVVEGIKYQNEALFWIGILFQVVAEVFDLVEARNK